MNTKVEKLKELYNMRLHKADRIVKLLDNHLPKRFYTSEIKQRCLKKNITVSDQIIRDVKGFRTKNSRLLQIIVEFAIENEKAKQRLENIE